MLRRKLKTLAGFNLHQQMWLIPLFFLSGLMRLAILALPFRWISPWLGQYYRNITLTPLATEEQQLFSRQIGMVIRAICKYTPWQSKCLVQAMLARIILHQYGIPHIIYLGLARSDTSESGLEAHAWVNSGKCFVTGANGYRNFTVVASYYNDYQQSFITIPCNHV